MNRDLNNTVVFILLAVALFFCMNTIRIQSNRIDRLATDLLSTVELVGLVSDTQHDNSMELYDALLGRVDQNTDLILQGQVDDAWYQCRIWHDLDLLFRTSKYYDEKLNGLCENQFYLDDKPTVEELFGD